jgi:serine/threonine protein kinase
MQVNLASGKQLTLTSNSFLTQGGEGSIYVDQSTVYKIYNSIDQTISSQKIQELSVLNSDLFILPQMHVFNDKSQAIGYQMSFIPQAIPLCKLFSASYKQRHKIDSSILLSLIEQLKQGIEQAHQHHILLVDLNDQNFLVSADHRQLYFVDVDSYQTPNFPATALMDSIKDWHTLGDTNSKAFSEYTDWFSFSIICFQLLIGIHPYKGKHPHIRGLIERMKASISVFDTQVKVPKICPSLHTIPEPFKTWLKSVLQDKVRSIPPCRLDLSPSPIYMSSQRIAHNQMSNRNKANKSSQLCIDLLQHMSGHIRQHIYHQGMRILILDNTVHINDNTITITAGQPISVIFEVKSNLPIIVVRDQSYIMFINPATHQQFSDSVMIDQVVCDLHQIHMIYKGNHQAMNIRSMGQKLIPIVKSTTKVMPHASLLFKGGLLQNMLGKYVFSAFEQGYEISTIRIPELDQKQIIEAYYSKHVLMVKWRDQQHMMITQFCFDSSHYMIQNYNVNHIDQVDMDHVEFIVTSNGVGVWLRATGDLELFHTQSEHSKTRSLVNVLKGSEQLSIEVDKVVMIDQNTLSSVALV